MPLIRKRRANPTAEEPSDTQPQETPPQRRRTNDSPASAERSSPLSGDDNHDGDGDADSGDDDDGDTDSPATRTPNSTDVMVKKLVRLALASEYARQPIRRNDISTKVLGEQGSRPFKIVFEEAQKALRTRFGMEMVELPQKEKVTVSQRRAAQRVEKPSSTNKSWILSSTLPQSYRIPTIIPPTRASSSTTESTNTALYTFIISVITLNGGTLAEQKLERYLGRANADSYTPIERTDRLLQRLCKEGYIVRNREMDGGEEVVEYMVGPRGKAEVGARGVGGVVREVYGLQRGRGGGDEDEGEGEGERERIEEFENRLKRSLGFRMREGNGEGENLDQGSRGEGGRRRPSRRQGGDGAEDEGEREEDTE